MTGIQFFAFVALPILLAAGGWALVLFNERKHRMHPGE
jgi:hypothetical protein